MYNENTTVFSMPEQLYHRYNDIIICVSSINKLTTINIFCLNRVSNHQNHIKNMYYIVFI